jgi:hypothetical protein
LLLTSVFASSDEITVNLKSECPKSVKLIYNHFIRAGRLEKWGTISVWGQWRGPEKLFPAECQGPPLGPVDCISSGYRGLFVHN